MAWRAERSPVPVELSGLFVRGLVSPPPASKVSHASTWLISGCATSDSSALSSQDPAEARSLDLMEEGTHKLEDGDVEGARDAYKRSLEVKKTAAGLFNLGVSVSDS